MANKPLPNLLPADLPENWQSNQIVAPTGAEVGLAEQYGYNYLMAQLNAAQQAINNINNAFPGLASLTGGKIPLAQLPVDEALSNTSGNPVQNKVINAALAGKVPTTRKVNGKALSADISLSAADVGAAESQTLYSLNEINNLALKNGIYSFDLRQAGESITTVDGTVITTGAIIHLKHNEMNAYPCQLLIPYAAQLNVGIWKRWASNTTWQPWYRPTDYAPITTQAQLDSQTRTPGIYYCHLAQTFPLPAGTKNYFMLIHGRFENGASGYAQQIAIPFDSGSMTGLYYRIANGSTWGAWRAVGADAPNTVKTVFTDLSFAPGNWYTPEVLTPAQMNDPNFPYTYIGTIGANGSSTLGLPGNWWHILYFRHYDNNGYGAQIALPLNYSNSRARYRTSYETTWSAWNELYDSGHKPTATDVGALPITGGTLAGQLSLPKANFTAMSNNPTPGWIMSGNNGVGLSYYTNIDQLMRLINNRSNKVTESNTDYNIGITRAIVLSTTTPSSITNGVIVGVY